MIFVMVKKKKKTHFISLGKITSFHSVVIIHMGGLKGTAESGNNYLPVPHNEQPKI